MVWQNQESGTGKPCDWKTTPSPHGRKKILLHGAKWRTKKRARPRWATGNWQTVFKAAINPLHSQDGVG
ncbi:MAG: hypothetical protein CMJ81_23920 [Planctomycetaceae bacterium]|nr:hypothetical protein [Planctomycetaceae bacterium]